MCKVPASPPLSKSLFKKVSTNETNSLIVEEAFQSLVKLAKCLTFTLATRVAKESKFLNLLQLLNVGRTDYDFEDQILEVGQRTYFFQYIISHIYDKCLFYTGINKCSNFFQDIEVLALFHLDLLQLPFL
uniref:CSON003238 protein n=1 Tax=Culicoides sonorensis TaxID=179676 RepID=A0A336LSM7_CULSO